MPGLTTKAKLFLPWVFLGVLLASPILASSHRFGLGILIGIPTGLSWKVNLSERNAVDGAFAWSFIGSGAFVGHVDYLWHKQNLFPVDKEPIDLFFGIGARMLVHGSSKNADSFGLGPRIPLGLRHFFRDPPIEIFFEGALILDLIPSTGLAGNIGIGARYFF